MSANINPTFFAQEFKAVLEPALQQMGSRLRETVTVSTTSGVKQAVAVDRLGTVAAVTVAGQLQTKVPVNAATDRRWVVPISKSVTQILDHFDVLRTLNDPMSATVQNAVNALGRSMDDEVITAALGTSKSGETGSGSTSFDTTNNRIAVNFQAGGNTGLTVAKLRQVRKILYQNEVDLDRDPLYCVITAKQHDDLLKEAQVIGREYNDQMVLANGKVTEYMGFKFIHSERLGVDGSSYRRVIAYVKSGVHLKVWEDIKTNVYQNTDYEGDPWETYAMATFGATRTDEKRVVEVLCNEA